MDFPLDFHKKAFKAHEAANCAGDQGKFWEMHDKIFETKKMTEADLDNYAKSYGLDMATFSTCLSSGKYAADIRQDIAEGRKVGITGTPSFVIGMVQPGSTKIKAAVKIRGAQGYQVFKESLDKFLADNK